VGGFDISLVGVSTGGNEVVGEAFNGVEGFGEGAFLFCLPGADAFGSVVPPQVDQRHPWRLTPEDWRWYRSPP